MRADLLDARLAGLIGISREKGLSIVEAVESTNGMRGDVCEFGVAQGATSALIAEAIMGTESNLHLFDSFQGLPAPTDKDVLVNDIFGLGSMEAYRGLMASAENEVRGRLAAARFPSERTIIHAGFLEQTLRGPLLPNRVRFAFVDVDFYESTKQAIKFLTSVAVPGTIAIVDDYGFFSSGVRAAVQETAEAGGWSVKVSREMHSCTMRMT